MLLYSSYDNTLSICSTKHIMQVYFVLRKELLQAGILELDTLFSLLSTLDRGVSLLSGIAQCACATIANNLTTHST